MSDALFRACLDRLGLDAEPPSIAALRRLHRAHVERVPWETLWIHQGCDWPVDPLASVERIATTGRGGYCFHLNGALALLLEWLGYRVQRHCGAVHGGPEPAPGDMGNHLVLTVHDLPDESGADGAWYVDAGLGDALHEPVPLREGVHHQDPFDFMLEAPAPGTWRLTHDPVGGFPAMTWTTGVVTMDRFQRHHLALSGSPESRFVQVLTVQRRDATGVDALRGRTLRRIGSDARTTLLGSRHDLDAALRDVFGINPGTIDLPARERIWQRAMAAHERWLRSQAATG